MKHSKLLETTILSIETALRDNDDRGDDFLYGRKEVLYT